MKVNRRYCYNNDQLPQSERKYKKVLDVRSLVILHGNVVNATPVTMERKIVPNSSSNGQVEANE